MQVGRNETRFRLPRRSLSSAKIRQTGRKTKQIHLFLSALTAPKESTSKCNITKSFCKTLSVV